MQSLNRILITTTSTLSGVEVESYLGVVTSHVVAGTGMFSDIAASFSDMFGGRSESYQRQLTAIENEAISQLQEKALSKGANAILGLRLDFDEISGKNKTMFMVTATGTAVRTTEYKKTVVNGNIDAEALDAKLKRKRIIDLIVDDNFDFNNATNWNYLIDLRIGEVAGQVTEDISQKFSKELTGTYGVVDDEIDRFKKYYYSIDPGIALPHLYELVNSLSSKAFKFAYSCIFKLELFDFNKVNELLNSDELYIRKRALVLLDSYKGNYTVDDIDCFKSLAERIKEVFIPLGQVYNRNKMFGGKQVEVWKCQCGKENEETQFCKSCSKDIYGFLSGEKTHMQALEDIGTRITVLQAHFNIN